MNKTSEAFDSARSEYIEGYVRKNDHIFPTLSLVAKEFNISLSNKIGISFKNFVESSIDSDL